MRRLISCFVLVCSVALAFGQGSTTANVSGRVTDQNGEALPGAAVVAIHTPTGTKYGIITDTDGYYRLSNVRTGGPYNVSVTFVGYGDFGRNDVYVALGQTLKLDVEMSEQATELSEVTITARKDEIIDGNRTGAETVVTEEMINAQPTVARAIGDFARLSPVANITEGNDGFSISLNGMNNRYNAIYINGAVNNDVFGLAGSGTNGGQTGVSPISIDAVEEWQVQIAPFDVRLAGFAGGSINAVTRSGSNEVHGSAYYFFRNQSLAGKTPVEALGTNDERSRLADFTASTFGLRVGGPIIKDKLFYFISAESQRDETPQPFNFSTYQGDATRADLDALEAKLRSPELNSYDPGGFENNATFLNSDKFFLRLDYNISDNHKLYFSHNYVNARNLEAVQSFPNSIRYINSSEYFPSTTNSSVFELNSSFGNKANKLTLSYTDINDDRDPYNDPYPSVLIDDGSGSISFGSEQFSTANALRQKIFTLSNNFEIFKGAHTFLIGGNFEYYDVYNLFIRQNYGVYEFNTLQDFLNDGAPREFFRSYSLVDDVTGDGSEAAAIFKAMQAGIYVQDDWQLTDQFKLSLGLRGDFFIYPDKTPENTQFNSTTIPAIESFGYSLRGAQTGKFVDPQFYVSPRLGFNWDVTGEQTTQVRGGAGIFVSRAPLVWPGGAYNNNGLTVGGDFTTSATTGWYRDYNAQFNPQWDNQPQRVAPGQGQPSGEVELFASDFRLPSFAKFNVAVDQKLPWGLIGTAELIYTKTLNNVFYENLNLKPSTENLEGADNRPYYDRFDRVDGTYSAIYLGSGTNLGWAWNGTVSLTKPFDNGLMAGLSYTYGDSYSIYDGTSSQNSSQWRGQHSIIGRNYFQTGGPQKDDLQRSDFSMGSRVFINASYRKTYGKNFASQIGFLWNIQSGARYSFIYNDGGRLNNEDSRERSLIYVPANQSEIILVDDQNYGTAAEQWAALDAYISSNDYLNSRRGQYAERNMNRTPTESILDLRFLQDFYITSGSGRKHTLQFSVDIYNFGNMLSKEWGKRYNRRFDGWELLNFDGFTGTRQPTFKFNPSVVDRTYFVDDSGLTSSRWQMQVGARYLF